MGGSGAASSDPPVRVARIAGLIAILAYAASWVANQQVPGYRDPLWLRAAVGVFMAAVVVGTYTSAWIGAHLPALIRSAVYGVTLHDYLLLAWNRLDALQVVGTYLVLAGVVATSSLFVTRPRHLAEYLVLVTVLSIGVVVYVDQPRTGEAQFLIGIATFSALSYVAVRSHLKTLQRLSESEAQARAVLRAVPDALFHIRRDGIVAAVLGEPRGELAKVARALVGRPFVEMLEPPHSLAVATFAGEARAGEARSFSAPVRREPGAGPLHVEIRIVHGDARDRLALVRDVTRERQLEERLRVTDRLAAVGTLASGIAHEINNPLSYVLSNLKFAAERLRGRLLGGAGVDDGERQEELSALDDARRGADRIGNIVRSLKDYASGAETLELSADAAKCVEAALRVLASEIRHRAAVSVELDPMPRLRAEPFRVTQVLVNLVTNALQALPADGKELGHIWIRGRSAGTMANIEVVDDGCGIREGDLGRIFDPFFTSKPPGQGTGLGLFVCHQIISAFGGTIDVTSEEGVGTTFRIVLPTIEPSLPPPG